MSAGRRPDLNVQKLNPGVTLSWNDGLEIALWPAEPRALPPAREPKASSDPSDVRGEPSDPDPSFDEIPFE